MAIPSDEMDIDPEVKADKKKEKKKKKKKEKKLEEPMTLELGSILDALQVFNRNLINFSNSICRNRKLKQIQD